MTVSTSRNYELNIGQIVTQAYRKAGLLNVNQQLDDARAGSARVELDTIIKRLQTKGLMARTIVFETVELVSGQNEYTMPDYVLDVVEEGMWINPTQTDLTKANGELPVRPISREHWHSISTKAVTGVPRMYFCNRNATQVKVVLWPGVSDAEAGGHIRFQVHQLRSDTLDANATVDAEPYWEQYFIYALAHELALNDTVALARCDYLNKMAQSAFADCKAYSNQRTDQQIILAHRTSWR